MRQLDFKKTLVDFESKKSTWVSLGVPQEIINGLQLLAYKKPSIIQSVSIPRVLGEPNTNFLFQANYGSGKTGAYAVPSLMKVDKTINKI